MQTPAAKTQPTQVKNRDIVIVSIQPWYYELGSNCKNIALELAKHNRVLYVNIPITRKTFYSKNNSEGVARHCNIIKNKGNRLEQIGNSMWQFYPNTLIESINFLPFTSVFSVLNYINNKRFAGDIKEALAELGFKQIILFNDNDIYNGFYLKELLAPAIYIYYMRDFLQGYAFWKKHSSVLEPKLIGKADLVATNSLYYSDYCLNYNPQTVYTGQGCKLDLFNPSTITSIPGELQIIRRPIIGYVGALDSSRLDHQIIETIATANENWQVVLVGPEDEAFRKSTLKQYKNIHFLGRKPMVELASYVSGFDVCINPQLINPITKGNYPLKIDEYLAMGKPVVATYTKTMELFKDYVYLANNAAEYPSLIKKAIAEHSFVKAEEGKVFAHSHTWENSVNSLYTGINSIEI